MRNHHWGKSEKGHGAGELKYGFEIQVGNTPLSLALIHIHQAESFISSGLPGSSQAELFSPSRDSTFPLCVSSIPSETSGGKEAGYMLGFALTFLPLRQHNLTQLLLLENLRGDFKAYRSPWNCWPIRPSLVNTLSQNRKVDYLSIFYFFYMGQSFNPKHWTLAWD